MHDPGALWGLCLSRRLRRPLGHECCSCVSLRLDACLLHSSLDSLQVLVGVVAARIDLCSSTTQLQRDASSTMGAVCCSTLHRMRSSAQHASLPTQGCLEAAECLAEVLKVGVGSPLSHPGIYVLAIQTQSLHDMGSVCSRSRAGAAALL